MDVICRYDYDQPNSNDYIKDDNDSHGSHD